MNGRSKIFLMTIASIFLIGAVNAEPTGNYGDYALTGELPSYQIDDASAISTVSTTNQDVTIEYLNNGTVVYTQEDVSLNDLGNGGSTISESFEVTQLAIYPSQEDVTDISGIEHYYNYDTSASDPSNIDNYDSSKNYLDIRSYNSDGSIKTDGVGSILALIGYVIPIILLLSGIQYVNKD